MKKNRKQIEAYLARAAGKIHARAIAPFKVVRAPGDDEGEWIIEGTASVDGFRDDGILLEPAYMPTALGGYMEFGLIQASHSMSARETVGKAQQAEFDASAGVFVRAMVSKAEPDIWTKIGEELLRAFSLGFWVTDGEWDPVLEIFRATEYEILEISIVPLPADRGALFQVARDCFGQSHARELRELFGARGESPEDDAGGEWHEDPIVREMMMAAATRSGRIGQVVGDVTSAIARNVHP